MLKIILLFVLILEILKNEAQGRIKEVNKEAEKGQLESGENQPGVCLGSKK